MTHIGNYSSKLANLSRQYTFNRGNEWLAVNNNSHPSPIEVDLLYTFEHATSVISVRISPSEALLATGCMNATHIYDLRQGSHIASFINFEHEASVPCFVISLCFSPDEKFLATSFVRSATNPLPHAVIKIWDIEDRGTPSFDFELTSAAPVADLLFSEDGQTLVAACKDGTVMKFDVKMGSCIQTISPPT